MAIVSPVVAGFLALGALCVAVAVLAHLLTRRFVLACAATAVVVGIGFQLFVQARWEEIFPHAWATGSVVALPVAMLVGLAFKWFRGGPAPTERESAAAETPSARGFGLARKLGPLPAACHVLYIYRVPSVNAERFLRIHTEMAAIYASLDAQREVLEVSEPRGQFGCAGLLETLRPAVDELLFVGVDSFRDQADYNRLRLEIERHPRIAQLQEDLKGVLEIGRIVRAELRRTAAAR